MTSTLTYRLGRHGELIPVRGMSRRRHRGEVPGSSTWTSHDGLVVVSAIHDSYLPGTDDTLVGPQWLVSVSRPAGPDRCNVSDDDLLRVVECFAMPAWDEDNHHPGVARHLWCPLDEQYRHACECKVSEVLVDTGGYEWTTDRDGPCRGCEYDQLTGMACPVHSEVATGRYVHGSCT